jgi:hypothetical protein
VVYKYDNLDPPSEDVPGTSLSEGRLMNPPSDDVSISELSVCVPAKRSKSLDMFSSLTSVVDLSIPSPVIRTVESSSAVAVVDVLASNCSVGAAKTTAVSFPFDFLAMFFFFWLFRGVFNHAIVIYSRVHADVFALAAYDFTTEKICEF